MAEVTVKVGIDVAKKDFEACLLRSNADKKPPRHSASNDAKGFASLVSWAKKAAGEQDVHFCMESTGGYELALACYLASAGLLVSVENPRRIKHFAVVLGVSNKTDRADARTIAAYAMAMEPRPWRLMDEMRRELAQLGRHRENLIVDLGRVRNRLEHPDALPKLTRSQLEALQKLLEEQLVDVEKEQRTLIEESGPLQAETEVLEKLSGVGFVTAVAVLSEMPDVREFDDAQSWVAQAGMFPCRQESGKWKGQTRMCKAGNAHVRRALYMGATRAMQLHPVVKALAQRLRAKGQKAKQVRVACMRKILVLCYGVLKAHSLGKTPFYGLPPLTAPQAAKESS